MSHPEGREEDEMRTEDDFCDERGITTSCFMCPDCAEWTSGPDPCCGVGPASTDIELEDR